MRLIEIISSSLTSYEKSEITILDCPQDEGVARNKGQIGTVVAPDAIRRQFYKLTNFELSAEIFDLGDMILPKTCRNRNSQILLKRKKG